MTNLTGDDGGDSDEILEMTKNRRVHVGDGRSAGSQQDLNREGNADFYK